VHIDGKTVETWMLRVSQNEPLVVRVGKKIKKIRLIS